MEDKDIRGCITCVRMMKKCSGECGKCDRAIDTGEEELGCRCIECYDEETDTFKYYEPSEELLTLIGRGAG